MGGEFEIQAASSGDDLAPGSQNLIRSGWNYLGKESPYGECVVWTFERKLDEELRLRWMHHISSNRRPEEPVSYYSYEVVNIRTVEITEYPDWEWADLDNERLVWAVDGRLWAAASISIKSGSRSYSTILTT